MPYHKKHFQLFTYKFLFICCCLGLLSGCFQKKDNYITKIAITGLQDSVEVVRDTWGINHIYAKNQEDLFFTQGYCAARDRLFQFEMWRRQATGTVAEILGPQELKRDIGTRLFMFRGDIKKELNHYHPDGEAIIKAYVAGVNTYITETERNPNLLPKEFKLLGIKPGKWRPEIVISRHQGLLGNIGDELNIAKAVALLGPKKVGDLSDFHPGTPNINLDRAINKDLLFDNILELYDAFRKPLTFLPQDIINKSLRNNQTLSLNDLSAPAPAIPRQDRRGIGSNNWVVKGTRTASGYTMLANDPHRSLAIPSLRYWAHLVAPNWNVIGGGEPEIPGISIGHNEYAAWGLTVFETDAEDLYVYDTHPENTLLYRYKNQWDTMKVIQNTIAVKGQKPVIVDLKYTRHGPVVYEDTIHHKAYALRCGWMEIGGSPYLASLRMDQAITWKAFREACAYSHIPGENMVWADVDGNIGWQAVGIAPIRPNWSGLVPVPGDGRYEWNGYLPIKEKPNVYNPAQGFKVTANNNQLPPTYPHRNAVGYTWSPPYRAMRIEEVLKENTKLTMEDMMALQTDYLSIPARTLVPLLKNITFEDAYLRLAREKLLEWDYKLYANSVAAGIYVAWENQLSDSINALFVPNRAREYITISETKIIDWLTHPGSRAEFGRNPVQARNQLLRECLEKAVAHLTQKLGDNVSSWEYGQENYKHVLIRHLLSGAVNEELRKEFNAGPLPRGGYGYTVNSTGSRENQVSGATFRLIVDTEDWDKALGTNSPGQSGNPESVYYKNLFDSWADNEYFPVFYSRDKIDSAADYTWQLVPKQ